MAQQDRILDERAFRDALSREVVRCRMMISESCLVTIPLDGVDSSGREGLVDGVLGQLRGTDHVGWLRSSELALLLLDTGPDGARKVLEKLQRIEEVGEHLTDVRPVPLPLEEPW